MRQYSELPFDQRFLEIKTIFTKEVKISTEHNSPYREIAFLIETHKSLKNYELKIMLRRLHTAYNRQPT